MCLPFFAPRRLRTVSRVIGTGVCFLLFFTWFFVIGSNKDRYSVRVHRSDLTKRKPLGPDDSFGVFLDNHRRFTATNTVIPFTLLSPVATTLEEEAQHSRKFLASNYSLYKEDKFIKQSFASRPIAVYQDNHEGPEWRRIGRFQFKFLPEDLDLPLKNVFHLTGSVVTRIQDIDFTFESDVCEEGRVPFLVVLIPSLSSNIRARDTIRRTWGSAAITQRWVDKPLSRRVALVFLFATESYSPQEISVLRRESQQHGDVIAGKMTDSYSNLTMKLLVGIQWVVSNCPGLSFLAKVDEDTFVNLDLLTQMLDALRAASQTPFILGYHHLSERPQVMRSGRRKVSFDAYPLPVFPRYLYGHSYVISAELMTTMLHTALKLPLFSQEDAFFTGVLAVALNITRIHSQRFAVTLRTMYTCDLLSERFLSVTPMGVRRHLKIWNAFRSEHCDPSDVIKKSGHPSARDL